MGEGRSWEEDRSFRQWRVREELTGLTFRKHFSIVLSRASVSILDCWVYGHNREMEAQRERTFVMIKPDGVQRFLVGEIISRFERRGYKLVGMKFLRPSEDLLRQHYTDLAHLPFFPKLLAYVSSGPVVAMIWEGTSAVSNGRKMVGATRPGESLPGTIRGDYALDVGRNVIHASDSVESANREIGLWFTEAEQASWTSAQQAWIYE